MEKQCAHCGKILPSDNTRCNNCGKVVPSSRPIKRSLSEEPPAWMKQLESSLTSINPPGRVQDRLADVSTISLKRVQASNTTSEDTRTQPASGSPELSSPQEVPLHDDSHIDNAPLDVPNPEAALSAKPLTGIPPRELYVKVWEEEETGDLSLPEDDSGSIENKEDVVEDLPTSPLSVAVSTTISRQPLTISNYTKESFDDKEIVDDLPTGPLVASPAEIPAVRYSSSPPVADSDSGSDHVAHPDEIEKILTRPLLAQQRGKSISLSVSNPGERHKQALRTPVESVYNPVPQRPVTPVPLSQPQLPPARALRQTPPISMPVPPVARPKRNSRKRLVIVFILLFTLLVGGMSAWVIVFRPFTVPEITNTTQAFRNTDLGVTLRYPHSWTAEVAKQNGAVSFYDDNRTDQVNITSVATGNQSIDQYIIKEVGSLGMTGQKTEAPLSFAGASWQHVQGTVLQSGANYTAMLLVTLHAEHYYVILQLAPSSTFTHEDQLVFANMRSSFQFI